MQKDPTINMILTKQECGIPLINIQEFIFHTSPEKRLEATFWFKYALQFFENIDPNNIERCLITLGVFCSNFSDVIFAYEHIQNNVYLIQLILIKQFEKAEGLFNQALDLIGESDNYNKILCLQMYGNLLLKNESRYKEGELLIAQAHQIAQGLPFWYNKLNYVIIPKLDLS